MISLMKKMWLAAVTSVLTESNRFTMRISFSDLGSDEDCAGLTFFTLS